jgi:CDGSH-type Zn-finger protein
LPFLGIA